jgi:site-specific DNA-methyltransferase (adenine-specific)
VVCRCFVGISQRNRNGKLHPTQKPVELLEYLIKTYSNEGDIVLDNCMGSGSTAIAAINTNRNYVGYEMNEEYYNKSINRIKEHEK